jgi:hypothetical protein
MENFTRLYKALAEVKHVKDDPSKVRAKGVSPSDTAALSALKNRKIYGIGAY